MSERLECTFGRRNRPLTRIVVANDRGFMSGAGSLGTGRLVVLPPVVAADTREVDVVAFGANAWWASAMQRLGREAVAIVQSTRQGTPLYFTSPPSDADVRSIVLHPEVDGRFAMQAEHAKRPGEPIVIVRARLFEVRGGLPTRPLGEWTFQRLRDADLDLASTAFEVLVRVGTRMGQRPVHRDWRNAFESNAAGSVVHLLRVLGMCDLAARGHEPRTGAAGLRSLVSALQAAPRMRPALELFPVAMSVAARDPSVGEIALTSAWRDAVEAVGGAVPEQWRAVPERIRGRAPLRTVSTAAH